MIKRGDLEDLVSLMFTETPNFYITTTEGKVPQYIENPEFKREKLKLEIQRMKDTRELLEERLISISKEILEKEKELE